MERAGTGRPKRGISRAGIALIAALSAIATLWGSHAAWAQKEIFATNFSPDGSVPDTVTVYHRTADGKRNVPIRTLSGTSTGLIFPAGVALDPVNNHMWVANLGGPSIAVYNRYATGDTPPLRTIRGLNTNLAFPAGLALDLVNNEVLVTNTSSVTAYRRAVTGPEDEPPR